MSLGAYPRTLTGGPSGPAAVAGLNATARDGAGSLYTLTTTPAPVIFGTTNPDITLGGPGVYLVTGQIQLNTLAATASTQNILVKFRRTNNTPADLPTSLLTIDVGPMLTRTATLGIFSLPPVLYSTTTSGDKLTFYANLSAALGAGAVVAIAAGTNILALKAS